MPTANDHSGVFVRAQCDKCGAWANVELPVNIAAAWKAASDTRISRHARTAWAVQRILDAFPQFNANEVHQFVMRMIDDMDRAAGDVAAPVTPCAHKHVITTKEGAKCRDCPAPLRFEQRTGLYVEAV